MAEHKRYFHPRPDGSSKVQRHLARETDINFIMDRSKVTGRIEGPQVPRARPRKPMFGDFSNLDFQDMMHKVMDVQNQFEKLPPKVRRKFMGSAAEAVRFASNPENRLEALKLGLVLPNEDEAEAMAEAAVQAARNPDQVDLVEESGKGQKGPEKAPEPVPEPDDEAQPRKGKRR